MPYPTKQSPGGTTSTKKIGDGYRPHGMRPSAKSAGANVKESKLNAKESYYTAKKSK